MKYIIASTDNKYFRWQILVQINNFKRIGILDDVTYVISTTKNESKELSEIRKATGARILTYPDTRKVSKYVSSVRPHILAKHFRKFKEESELYFYLDPDVLFKQKLEFPKPVYTSPVWFLSNTTSYIDSGYIKGKSEELFELMCNEVGVDPKLVESMDLSAGGAQYIIKNAGYSFWKKVETDSEKLYDLMINTQNKYSPKHPIQAWTADMWAVLWNAWMFKHNTVINSGLNFSWATDTMDKYDERPIYHNAGVFSETDLFNKGKFSGKHPFDEDFSYVDKNKASYKYVEEILDTKKNYEELIKKL